MKNRMNLSLGIAVGSSSRIALFVAPVLVLLSYVVGPAPTDLVFSYGEGLAVILSNTILAGLQRRPLALVQRCVTADGVRDPGLSVLHGGLSQANVAITLRVMSRTLR